MKQRKKLKKIKNIKSGDIRFHDVLKFVHERTIFEKRISPGIFLMTDNFSDPNLHTNTHTHIECKYTFGFIYRPCLHYKLVPKKKFQITERTKLQ